MTRKGWEKGFYMSYIGIKYIGSMEGYKGYIRV